jgi:hypothetical protein
MVNDICLIGLRATIENGDGNNQLTTSIGRTGTILYVRENFIFLDIPNVGIRGTLREYVQPVIDGVYFSRRYGE